MKKVLLSFLLMGLTMPVYAKDKQGPQGETGEQGQVGPQGVQGETGANGQDGINGVNGQNGTDGVNGVNGNDGNDGQNGINGTAGIDGVNGATGPKGERGNIGNTGATGKTGPQGVPGRDAEAPAIDPRLDVEIRELDTKHWSVSSFASFGMQSSTARYIVGQKLTLKLGKSYEEKRLDQLENKLNVLVLQ